MNPLRVLSAFAVALTAAALTSSSVAAQQPAPPPADIAGEYALAQIDDAELPIVINEADGCRREITSGTLTLAAENRWTLHALVRETCGEDVSQKAVRQRGTFTTEENALQFTVAAAEAESAEAAEVVDEMPLVEVDPIAAGTRDGDVIRVTLGEGENSRTLVFRR